MAREALLDRAPIPRTNIHPVPTLLPQLEEVAEAYEDTLMSHLPGRWPRFDLVLLGLGSDGHIASLFPRNRALEEDARVVAAVRAEAAPPLRVTLTLPAINHAANVYFLAAGAGKATAVRRALSGTSDVAAVPAAGVRLTDGALVWWLDEAAAPSDL
jgi:6-phosphogluconolactonase